MKLEWLLAVQAFTSIGMAGVIWIVQVVHYPLFAQVGEENFTDYAAGHNRLITWVVGPLMLIEFFAALLLLGPIAPAEFRNPALLGVTLLAILWLTTFCLSVPAHAVLADGFDVNAHRKLVTTNWIRTAGWTLRAILSIWMILQLPKLT